METPRQTVAICEGERQIRLVDEPIPVAGPGQILVRNRACALCTMERRVYLGRWDGYPIIPGHEVAGEVAGIGPDVVLDVSIGDRVAIAVMDRCMQCEACRSGNTHLCTGKAAGRRPGELRRLGGLGRYLVVAAHKVYPMPQTMSFEHIALTEPLACVVHSIRRGDIRFGDDVVILGGGTMGHLHMLLARLTGARVLVCDPEPKKRALAEAHGAHRVCDPDELLAAVDALTGGRGVERVFVTFGSQQTGRAACDVVAPGGRVIFYASFPADVTLDASVHRVHKQEVCFDGAANQSVSDWQEATRLLARGLLDLQHLISDTFPLDRIDDAMARAATAEGFRTVVRL